MAVPNNKRDDALLKNLVPLNTLSEEQLGQLLSRIVIQKARKGEYLFREGDSDHQNIYLLSGSVALLSGHKEMDMVSSGTQTARFALAHQLPRKHSARAKNEVTYVCIDSRMLSDMLARSQTESYEVNEAESVEKSDWMSLLLRSPVFQQIPPANLQRVMIRMKQVAVSADQTIIQQGDEGDFFYLISRGVCRVSRQPEANHAPVELAQLKAGQGFGEESLISDKPRSSTVTMVTDGELVRLSKKDFVELVKQPLSRTIDYSAANKMIQQDALWVDVRTPEEYDAGHLPDAINLPFFSLRFQASSLASDRVYLIYGAEVGQSATAAYLLVERGYDIYMLSEGWIEIASQAGLETQEVVVQADNILDFNRDFEVSAQDATPPVPSENQDIGDIQQEQKVAKSKYEEKLSQYQTEQKLLKQALNVAKRKLEKNEKDAESARQALQQEVQQLQTQLAEEKQLERQSEKAFKEGERLLKKQVAKLEKKLTQLQDDLHETDSKAQTVDAERDRLAAQLHQQQEEHTQTQTALGGQLETLRQQLEETTAAQREQALQANLKVEESSESVVLLEEKLRSVQAQLEVNLKRASEELAAQEDQRKKLQQEYDEAKVSNSNREKEADVEITALKQALGQSQSQLMQLETDNKSLKKEQDHLRTEINELHSQVRQAADKTNAERNALEQQIQKLEDEGAAQTKELNILRQSSDAAGTEYQVLIDSMKAELDSAQESISELNQAKQQLLSERNDSEARLNESLAGASEHTEKLENELKSAHASLQASEKQYLGQIADFEVKLQEATQRQTELEAKKVALNESVANLEKTLAEEQAERGELATAFEKSTNDQERLSKELAGVIANLEQERRAKQEIEEGYSSLEQQRGRLEKELGEIKQAGDDADAQHQHLISSLRAELDQAKSSITELNRSHEQQLADRDAAESSLKSALSESDKQIMRLESELASAHESFKSTESSLAQQAADLERQLSSEQKDTEEKNKSLRQAESEIQVLTEKHSQLEARLSEAQTNDESLRRGLDDKAHKLEELQQKYAEIQQEVAAADTEHTETLNILQEKLVVTEAEVKEYAEALSKTRLELKKRDEEKTKLTARLEEEQHKSDFLKRSLATAEDAIEISDSAFNERGDELDAFKIQFKEFESVRDDLEKRLEEAQENLNLREMSLQETEQSHSDALEKLNKELVSVNVQREKVKAEDIEREAARKIEFEVLQAEKSEIEMELAELQNRLEAQIQALEVSETDRQQEIQRLLGELSTAKSELQELASAKGEAHDSAAALQAAHEEIARLNKNIDGLREVQLEMESQLSDDSEEEILKLRSALEQEEKKRRNAEELARQADVLKREREVQETAVEMLGEDLDELTRDKKQLEEDKKILERKLAEMRSQFSDLMDENNHLHTEMSDFRGQVDNSSMADDLLAQLEELRLKTDVFEQERDGARSDADRLKREVHELRSVIETYVEQIQDVQSYEGNDELTALRSELDMVRNQASADLQQMRKELSAAKGKVASLGGRDTNDAASLQAQRQEIDTTRQALHEKEHMLRLSQTQCRTLEDSIEDRDREVDQLKRKLELLIRKTGGLGEFSESIDSDTVMSHKTPPRGPNLGADHLEGLQAHGQPVTGNDHKPSTFGRLFRKK